MSLENLAESLAWKLTESLLDSRSFHVTDASSGSRINDMAGLRVAFLTGPSFTPRNDDNPTDLFWILRKVVIATVNPHTFPVLGAEDWASLDACLSQLEHPPAICLFSGCSGGPETEFDTLSTTIRSRLPHTSAKLRVQEDSSSVEDSFRELWKKRIILNLFTSTW